MNRGKNLEVILVLCVALVVFFLIFQIKSLLIGAAILGIIGIFSEYLSGKITWLWLKFAEGIGFIMSRIILTIVFFLFLLPIALLTRLFNKTAIQAKKLDQNTFYFSRNHEFCPKDLENMW